MRSTVAQAAAPRPKAKGRPIDTAVAQFELALESVLALEDDVAVLEHLFAGLRNVHTCVVRMEAEAEARIRRLREKIQPEAKRLLDVSDKRLTLATIERAARRASDRALSAAEAGR